MNPTVKFSATKNEVLIIREIAERAVQLARRFSKEGYDIQTAMMDIEACHVNGMPLNLRALANAELSDFAHDVFGIHRHMNRETGQLEDCFVPRNAKL